MDYSLQQLGYRLAAFLVIASIVGFTLAGVAWRLGDKGPAHDGRARLSPLVHLDLIGLVCAVLFGPGWIRPLDVEAVRLRGGRPSLAALPFINSALVLIVFIVLQFALPGALSLLDASAAQVATTFTRAFGEIGLWFALVNLAPIPSLAGEHFIAAARPGWTPVLRKLRIPCATAMLALSALGVHTKLFGGALRWMSDLLLR